MPNPKNYWRPQTLAEAIERAVQPGSIALVGGALTLGGVLLPYENIVDLQDLHELKRITVGEDGLHIGGSASLQNAIESPDVPDILKRSITRTLPLNIRNGASVAESLTTGEPPHEWLAALIALGAEVEHAGNLQHGDKSSLWEQTLEEFIQYLHAHHHAYQGIIVQVRIPPLPEHTATGTAFVARTPADRPIVNAAVRVTVGHDGMVQEAAAALGGAAVLPVTKLNLKPLVGSVLDTAHIDKAVQFVTSTVQPTSTYTGSSEYRRAMAGVCVRRALEQCQG